MNTFEETIPHPGVYIKEEIEARGWLQRDLAFILGCKEQTLNPLLSGKRGVSPDMARALSDAFGVSADLFLNLQKEYELAQAEAPSPGVAIRANIQSSYPIREMIKRGWIEDTEAEMLNAQLARFFCVSSVGDVPYLQHAAKKSRYEEREIPPAQLAWLFRVRQIAMNIAGPEYSEGRLRRAIQQFADLMMEPEQVSEVPKILGECGVRLIALESLPGALIDGVCFWLDDKSPVVGMSLRYDRIDNFWFVLRHELEHVLLRHGMQEEIVDDLDHQGDSMPEEEKLANEAGAGFCVPLDKLQNFMARKHPYYYEKDVLAFSITMMRHPGIVVGQMQRKMNNYTYLRKHQVKVRGAFLPNAIADGWGQSIRVSL